MNAGPGRAEQCATRVVFFLAGFGAGDWAVLVPFAKLRLGLGEGALGLVLLCLGVGSIAVMPVAGYAAARFGCRAVLATASVAFAAVLPLLATVSLAAPFVVVLLVFGAALGTIDVAMNIQAIIVERASGRAMMSGFHGFFSLGGIVGAVGMAGLLSLGTTPLAATSCTAACILIALAASVAHLLPYGSRHGGPSFAVPRGVVLLMGVLCFVCFLAEGTVLDWSGVFLMSARHLDPSYAGLGYAAFAATMTLGRLAGDRIVGRFGGRTILLAGGSCAAAGFAVVTIVPSWQAALLGYALVGAGSANIVPVLFSAVGRQDVMPEAVAVPAITSLGYAGILAGPAGIGFVAHVAGLSTAFLVVAAMLLGVSASGRVLRVRD